MTKNVIIILVLFLLSACNNEGSQNEDPQAGAVALGTETMAPTPTLAPGVPTSTLQPANSTPGNGDPEVVVPTATATTTPTPSFTPTQTPEPAERFPLGQQYFFYENYEAAANEFQIALASGVLDGLQTQEALLKMGQSFYHLGQYQAAADAFNEILAQFAIEPTPTAGAETGVESEAALDFTISRGSPGQTRPTDAYYWLGLSHQNLGDCPAAIGAYSAYLSINPDMAAYVQPTIADCYLTLGDRTAAYEAYEAATEGEAPRIVRLNLHRRLADLYLEDENFQAAIIEYEAILSFAVTEGTRGQTHYLIGMAAQAAGNNEAANENFLIAFTEYPQAYESYLSLVQLVEAGFEVDQFQRGLVDYYADVFEPALTAFNDYIDANPVHREDVHLYLAWTYEALGNVPAAIGELDAYIEAFEPPPSSGEEAGDGSPAGDGSASGDLSAVANGILEKGKMQTRAGLLAEAIATYQIYLDRFPEGEDAPYAAWWSAALTEQLGNIPGAISLFESMAANYPDHQDADEALFYAGVLYRDQGNMEEAIGLWQQTAELFPDQVYGGAALLWLQKTLPEDEAAPFREQAANLTGDSYYILRANQQAQGIPPFTPEEALNLDIDLAEAQTETEEWLRSLLQLEAGTSVSELSPALLDDPALVRGVKLWRLGLREEARRELEAVRQSNSDDILSAYQLALFLRDLGLYRSSIAAAETVMNQTGLNGLTAPTFLAQLAYPVYYADLVTAEAEKYGYDPLLQFSLIRQESLYESFAISSAVAQGLSQVIPDTGAYIAGQLNWPEYENADLYRPYVGIAFGAFYLDQQLDAFNGFVPAALSAYNAGPGNAARWYGQVSDDIDRYHEIVNFAETKLYIERIYIGHVIYRHLYGD